MRKLAIFVALASLPCFTTAQSNAKPYVSVYPTETARAVTRTRELHYVYSRSDFTPPFRILVNNPPASSFATPEDTMRTRALAMTQLNYDLWLTTWDLPSQQILRQQNSNQAAIEKQKHLWQVFFSRGQQVLFKQIETRDYTILTYRVISPEGQDLGGLKLPSVFHKVGDKWLGTQDLASDPLLFESPWMTNAEKAEREAK